MMWLSLPAVCFSMALSQEIPQYPGFKLVWNDEFNVDGPPNPKDWIYELGFVRNQELQYYSKPNAFCKGGFLILEGRQERVKNEAYNPASPKTEWKKSREYAEFTSGSIKTASKHVWTYGRFECRGKFGITKGLWPAFWLTGPTREWPANGEIDVMEYYMHGYKANVAWGSAKKNVAIWRSTNLDIEKLATESGFANGQAWSEAFHTYRMDWDKDWIKLYVDGRLLNSVAVAETVNKSPDMKNPFHEPHHILLNLAIGATGGDPKFTKWPSQFVVDWVRVYQADEKGE